MSGVTGGSSAQRRHISTCGGVQDAQQEGAFTGQLHNQIALLKTCWFHDGSWQICNDFDFTGLTPLTTLQPILTLYAHIILAGLALPRQGLVYEHIKHADGLRLPAL